VTIIWIGTIFAISSTGAGNSVFAVVVSHVLQDLGIVHAVFLQLSFGASFTALLPFVISSPFNSKKATTIALKRLGLLGIDLEIQVPFLLVINVFIDIIFIRRRKID